MFPRTLVPVSRRFFPFPRPRLRAALSTKIHDMAVSGFGEGTNDTYDKARPSYPAETLHTIHQALTATSTKPLSLLEPGSGTGIFSRLLLSPPTPHYPTFDIASLVGIEPSSGMRGAWQRGLSRVPRDRMEGRRVRVVDGAFDDFGRAEMGEGSVDGVVIAQAWHWCPDHSSAFREIARYLRPKAPLIFLWNVGSTDFSDSEDPGWYRAIRDLHQPLDQGAPQYYQGLWNKCFEVPEYAASFEEAERGASQWSVGMTEDQLVERLFSKSYLTEANLSGQKRIDFEQEIRRIIRQSDKEWVDRDRGVFVFNYRTDHVIMRRRAT